MKSSSASHPNRSKTLEVPADESQQVQGRVRQAGRTRVVDARQFRQARLPCPMIDPSEQHGAKLEPQADLGVDGPTDRNRADERRSDASVVWMVLLAIALHEAELSEAGTAPQLDPQRARGVHSQVREDSPGVQPAVMWMQLVARGVAGLARDQQTAKANRPEGIVAEKARRQSSRGLHRGPAPFIARCGNPASKPALDRYARRQDRCEDHRLLPQAVGTIFEDRAATGRQNRGAPVDPAGLRRY